MKTRQEIINEMKVVQSVYEGLIYEIGLLTAKHYRSKDQNIALTINEKVGILQKVELQLITFERELKKMKEK